MHKRAARRKSQTEASATNKSSKVPQLGKFEVRQFILREYVKDPDHLYSIASQSSLNGNNDLAKYCVNQNSKPIDDLFESTSRLVSEERRGIPRIEVIRDTLRGECVEGCNWECIRCALEVLDWNHIYSVAFAEAVRNAMVRDRGKKCNIILVGSWNCRKTFLFAPVQHMFKTFSSPSNGKYTWLEAEDFEVMFLNDFRLIQQMIPWSDLLLLLEGQPVRFLTQKNHRATDSY